VHRFPSVPIRLASIAFLAACQARAPRPDPARDIAAAVGVPEPIELRIEGLDAGGAVPPQLGQAEALRRTLRSSPELAAALARVQVALAEADQARLLANPILSLVLRFPEGGGSVDVEAGIGQELLAYLRRPRRIAAADRRIEAAVADAVTTSLDVVASLRERYATVQALNELTPLLGERQRTLAKLTELARARLEAGEASRLDMLSLEAQSAELEIEIAEREAERRGERLALARAIGTPSLPAEWELEPWSALPSDLPGEEAWIRAALEHRPEIAARLRELEALGDERALAGVAWLAGAEAGVEAEREDGWSIGPAVAVPLPLFDDGSARRDRARAEVLAARAELLDVQRTVVEEVRRAYTAFQAAQANLERVRTRLIPLQRDRRAQVEAVYLAGESDVTPVLLAEQDLQESQLRMVELERKAAVSFVALERAVGGAGAMPTHGSRDEDETVPEQEGREGP
jgi:cobalt-zinc-cadmium efflux system outer membrane protein